MSKSLVTLMILFFLSFALLTTMVVFRTPLNRITRAKEDLTTSPKNTLLFVWPLTLKPDGTQSAKVTVFVRSINGKPLSNKVVTVSSTVGQINPASVTSDNEGKAEFELTSSTPGTAEVDATADNIAVDQKVTVKFQ